MNNIIKIRIKKDGSVVSDTPTPRDQYGHLPYIQLEIEGKDGFIVPRFDYKEFYDVPTLSPVTD